jgi:hypothetical protein
MSYMQQENILMFKNINNFCWMIRYCDEVRNRKNCWSRDSASSDFHMYETIWFFAYATTRFWSIALRSIRIVNLLISKWSRFAAQWRIDFLTLWRWSMNQALTTRSYKDDQWVKHSRHYRAEDDRARRALNEIVKLSWRRISRFSDDSKDELHRWDFRDGNFLYNEMDFPSRFSRQQLAIHSFVSQ